MSFRHKVLSVTVLAIMAWAAIPAALAQSPQPAAPPAMYLPQAIEVPQPRYFDGDIRAELALPDRFQTQRDHYMQGQFGECCCVEGCWPYGGWCVFGGPNYYPGGTRTGAGYSPW